MILTGWVIALLIEAVLLLLLPFGPQTTPMSILLGSIWLLIGIVSIALFKKESNRRLKSIFFNFSLFTVYVVGHFFYFFVGPSGAFFGDNAYSSVFALQYLQALNCLLLGFAIVFVVIDSVFANFRVYQKYLVSILIVGGVFLYYYHPFLQDAKYLYTTEEVKDYRAVSKAIDWLVSEGVPNPTVDQIAERADLAVWKDGEQVGVLYKERKIQRVVELLPYLERDNHIPLIYRPLFLNNIYMNVLCIVFIFLYFGYQYKNDPPQGAYIEKMIFLFLPYCSLEVLHHFAYIKSVEATNLTDIMQIGQYLSLANLLMIVLFFSLRLRFITSVKGEFYERELVSDAEHISRWRDSIDNLVVRHFLNPKAIHGRLFAPRTPRNEA
jgi:hypothetical protein